MTRETLLDRVIALLERAEFILSEKCDIRPRSFDVGARRGRTFLLIKVLSNIEGLGEDTSQEMRRLAVLFSGSPIVCGEHTNDHPLETGAVYLRYGIPCVNIETLHDYFLEEVPPLVYAAPGGLYVEIDGETLRGLRESKSISLGELAKALGVSRRTISKYESGMNATVDAALERPGPADEPPNDLQNATGLEKDALGALMHLGFDVFRTTRAPFNALSREDDNKVLTGVSDVSEAMLKKAKFMSSLADVAGTYSLYIVKGAHQSKAIGSTILIESEELKKIDDSDQLLDLYRKEPRKADTGK